MGSKPRNKSGEHDRRTVVRGAGAALLIRVLGIAATFGVQVALARALGAEGFGVYVFAASILTVASTLSVVGVNQATIRFVPAYLARRELAVLRGFLSGTRRLIVVVSPTIAALLAGAVWGLQDRVTDELRSTLYVAAASLPLLAAMVVLRSRLLALKQVVAANLPTQVLHPAVLATAVVAAALALSGRLAPYIAMFLHLGSVLVTVAVFFVLYRRYVPRSLSSGARRYDWPRWRPAALQMLLVASLNMINERTDVIMLGVLEDSHTTGLYAAAHRIGLLIPMGLVAVKFIVGPIVSEAHGLAASERLQSVLRTAALWILVFTAPVTAGVILLSSPLLSAFGSQFVAAQGALVILALGQLGGALCGPVVLLLQMTGGHRAATILVAIGAVFNVLLNLVLIPRFGINGAAVATSGSLLVWNLLAVGYVWTRMGLDPTILALVRTRRADKHAEHQGRDRPT